mgnify:CR=1 FL=1
MEKRKGKLIRISDEAHKKLKESDEPMSAQIDLALGIEYSPKRPSVEPLGSDTKRFYKIDRTTRLAIKGSVKFAIKKTSLKGIGATRKHIVEYLKKESGYINMVAQYGYINSAPHTKRFNTLIDNALKSLVRDEVVRMNRQFYILNELSEEDKWEEEAIRKAQKKMGLNELGEPKKRFWKR